MKIRFWGLIPLNRSQFIIIEAFYFILFLSITVFFFYYRFPAYIDDELILFHAKYLKYVSLFITFLIVVEAQFYLNGFIKEQKGIIEEQNDELLAQKSDILMQHEELKVQRDYAQEQSKVIYEQKKHITESINYASQIQIALIPASDVVLKDFDHFILYKPKETISGDFYWVHNHKGRIIVTVIDCTGHSVPGALLSVLGITYLNEIIAHAPKDISAGEILNQLRERVVHVFENKDKEKQRNDGMDMALYILEKNKEDLQFAGAFNSLYILRENKPEQEELISDSKSTKIFHGESHDLINLSGDSMPIGISRLKHNFITKKIKLIKNDTLYVFSDGYVDQFGGDRGKKFMTSRFRTLLLNNQDKNMSEQKEFLDKTIEDWRTQNPDLKLWQLDDITVLGLRI